MCAGVQMQRQVTVRNDMIPCVCVCAFILINIKTQYIVFYRSHSQHMGPSDVIYCSVAHIVYAVIYSISH